jgi:hypothetical protein
VHLRLLDLAQVGQFLAALSLSTDLGLALSAASFLDLVVPGGPIPIHPSIHPSIHSPIQPRGQRHEKAGGTPKKDDGNGIKGRVAMCKNHTMRFGA